MRAAHTSPGMTWPPIPAGACLMLTAGLHHLDKTDGDGAQELLALQRSATCLRQGAERWLSWKRRGSSMTASVNRLGAAGDPPVTGAPEQPADRAAAAVRDHRAADGLLAFGLMVAYALVRAHPSWLPTRRKSAVPREAVTHPSRVVV